MPKEDIFNEYAKIAVETGLVKVAKEDSSISKKSKNTRLDYSSSEAIQALYGIRPDGNESANYEKNIAEYAHPNSVVISPAHDKINGLVENINERQNIMLNIVNDPTNGHLNQRKYAKSELVQALVRVANDMDNKDEEELRILADSCIENISKKADDSSKSLVNMLPEETRNQIANSRSRLSGVSDSVYVGAQGGLGGIEKMFYGTLAGVGAGVAKYIASPLINAAKANPTAVEMSFKQLGRSAGKGGALAFAIGVLTSAWDAYSESQINLQIALKNAIKAINPVYNENKNENYFQFLAQMRECMNDLLGVSGELLSASTGSGSKSIDDIKSLYGKAAKIKAELYRYLEQYTDLHENKRMLQYSWLPSNNKDLYYAINAVRRHMHEADTKEKEVDDAMQKLQKQDIDKLVENRHANVFGDQQNKQQPPAQQPPAQQPPAQQPAVQQPAVQQPAVQQAAPAATQQENATGRIKSFKDIKP